MPKVQESKTLKFCLLGQCDCPNPSAISRDEIALWEKQGIITYLGETDDVRPFIESASCVVLPSFYKEGIPRVLLEAMSMGKPIITTNTSGCKECIVPPLKAYKNLLIGQNGILIPPKDAESLSLALSLLTPRKLMQMGAKAREFVVNRFCITRVINYYTSHIYSLLQSHKTNPIQTKSPNTNPILAFVSNTCFSMYNFRLKVLQSLKKSGFTIHIIAPFDSSTPKLQEEGFFMHHLYIDSRSLNPFKDLRTIAMLYKLFKQISPALVFNYTIKPAIYSSSVCNLLKIPNIAIITGLGYVFINDKGDTSSLKKTILRFIVCKMYQFALKNTQEVWFLNNDDKQEFLHYKLITQAKAFLLDSEGVDTEYFSPKFCKNRQSIKRRQDDEIIFLLIARMLWDKGVGEFVQAAQMLQDSIKTQDSYSNNGGGAEIK